MSEDANKKGLTPVEAKGEVGITASGQATVNVINSLNAGYTQLSGTFTTNQKKIAEEVNFAPNLKSLERIAENGDEQTRLLQEQNKLLQEEIKLQQKQIDDGKKSQRNQNAITISAIVVGIIIAIIGWVISRI